MGLRLRGQVNLEPSIRVAMLYWPGLSQLSSSSFCVRLSAAETKSVSDRQMTLTLLKAVW
jgi:hypothetical protein